MASLFVPSLVTLILDSEVGERGDHSFSADDHADTKDEESALLKAQWNVIFLVTAALHCTGGLVFALTASAKRQKWNGEEEAEVEDEEEKDNQKVAENSDLSGV